MDIVHTHCSGMLLLPQSLKEGWLLWEWDTRGRSVGAFKQHMFWKCMFA